jgi:hypothetical protein
MQGPFTAAAGLSLNGLSASANANPPPYHTFFTRLFGRCIHLRSLSLSTTNPTSILVNALSGGCRTLTELSIDGNIKDAILLSLWVEERCSNLHQCDKITKLHVKHRRDDGVDDIGINIGTSIGTRERERVFLSDYEELLGSAKTRFTSTVPQFEWEDLQQREYHHHHHRDSTAFMRWQEPTWDDFELIG